MCDEEGEKQIVKADLQRRLGKYNSIYHLNTEFYSSYPANIIFNDICQQLFQNDTVTKEDVKQDANKWKMSVNFKQDIDNSPIEEEQ